MGPIQDTVMDKAALKQHLTQAKMKPMACAVGVAKDRSAVVLLSKMQAPRAVEADLKKKLPDVTHSRFGHVSVEDGMTAVFQLNKAPPPGIDRQLVMTLKGTGYTHVKCVAEEEAD